MTNWRDTEYTLEQVSEALEASIVKWDENAERDFLISLRPKLKHPGNRVKSGGASVQSPQTAPSDTKEAPDAL